MTQQLEARAFAIWRFAKPLKWDVSYEEISDATGLTDQQIQYVLQSKGWWGKIGRGSKTISNTEGLARFHRSMGHRFDENALDVVDLMAL